MSSTKNGFMPPNNVWAIRITIKVVVFLDVEKACFSYKSFTVKALTFFPKKHNFFIDKLGCGV
jgi:hypothetical protein